MADLSHMQASISWATPTKGRCGMIPAEVEREIMRLAGLAERVTSEMAKRARHAAETDADYKAAAAKAFLKADGPVAEREAVAQVECETLYRDRRIAEALLQSAVEAGRNYRAQLDALRSINANLRFEMANATGVS